MFRQIVKEFLPRLVGSGPLVQKKLFFICRMYMIRGSSALALPILLLFFWSSVWFSFVKSADSLPGEPLYFIKGIRESAKESFSINTLEKANTYLEISDIKFEEIKRVVAENKGESAFLISLTKMNQYRAKSFENIKLLNSQRESVDEVSSKYFDSVIKQEEFLRTLVGRFSGEVASLIEKSIIESNESFKGLSDIKTEIVVPAGKASIIPKPTSRVSTPTPYYPANGSSQSSTGSSPTPTITSVKAPTFTPSPTPVSDPGGGKPKPTKIEVSG